MIKAAAIAASEMDPKATGVGAGCPTDQQLDQSVPSVMEYVPLCGITIGPFWTDQAPTLSPRRDLSQLAKWSNLELGAAPEWTKATSSSTRPARHARQPPPAVLAGRARGTHFALGAELRAHDRLELVDRPLELVVDDHVLELLLGVELDLGGAQAL